MTIAARAAALSLAVLSLLPAAGRAAEPEPVWSIGSGIGYGSGSLQGVGVSVCCTGSSAPTVYAPQPVLGAERKIAPSTWLLVSLSASFNTSSWPGLGANTYGSVYTSASSYSAGALLGARQVFTDSSAPVAVSAYGGATFGYASFGGTQVYDNGGGSGPVTTKPSAHQLGLGLTGGFSVERLLTDRLSLRLSARLVSVGYTRGSGKADETATAQDYNGFGASLGFDPSIELRLAF